MINLDGTFSKDFKVEYDRVSYNLKLKPQKAIEICQNIAIDHSDAVGYTADYFQEHKCGWILTDWHVIFSDLPSKNDIFKVITWTKPFRRLQADRSFSAIDSSGKELYRTMSRWFLMDTEKRRPMKLPEGFLDTYIPSSLDNCILDENYAHPNLNISKLESTRDFFVTRRDIDSNNHTNNIAYIEWAIDDISDDIYSNYLIYDLRANYTKETVKGDLIRSTYYIKNLADGDIETSSVFLNPDNDAIFCRITIKWKKK